MTEPVQTAAAGATAWSFFAPLGAVAVPLFVMWTKLRLDQLSARCDAFAKFIDEVATLSLDYWLLGEDRTTGQLPTAESKEASDVLAKTERYEIKLRGSQTVLQADVARLSQELPWSVRSELSAAFGSFITAVTGGKFGDRDGYREPMKARAAVAASARVVRLVRQGRDDVTKPHNLALFLMGRL